MLVLDDWLRDYDSASLTATPHHLQRLSREWVSEAESRGLLQD